MKAYNKKADYGFQAELVSQVVQSLLSKRKVVLAAAPGAGKTTMGIQVDHELRKKFSKLRTLILTHGQVIIREQWIERFQAIGGEQNIAVVRPGTKLGGITSPIVIALPQSLSSLPENYQVDLLIVDEAHQRYHAKQVQNIIEQVKPKYQLMLTGSPSKFIDGPDWVVHGITLSEMLDHGVACDPLIEIAEFSYKITNKSYNNNMNIRDDKGFTFKDTNTTLNKLLHQIIARLLSVSRSNPGQFSWVAEGQTWAALAANLQKTMIVCKDQEHAKQVKAYFDKKKVYSSLSISDLDSDNGVSALTSFKKEENCKVFIVVNRGILGFDYSELFNVIDISGSLNIDRLFQLLCRVVRVSKDAADQKKFFLKLTNDEMSALTYQTMSYVVALSQSKYYYCKTPPAKRKIPVKKEFLKLLGGTKHDKDGTPRVRVSWLPKLYTFTDLQRGGKSLESIAYTDFSTVRKKLSRLTYWSMAEAVTLAERYKDEGKTRGLFYKKEPGAFAFLIKNSPSTLEKLLPQKERMNFALASSLGKNHVLQGLSRKSFSSVHSTAYRFLFENFPEELDKLFPRKTRKYTVEIAKDTAYRCRDQMSREEFHRSNPAVFRILFKKERELLDSLWPLKIVRINLAIAVTQAKEYSEAGKPKWIFIKERVTAAKLLLLHMPDLMKELFPEHRHKK